MTYTSVHFSDPDKILTNEGTRSLPATFLSLISIMVIIFMAFSGCIFDWDDDDDKDEEFTYYTATLPTTLDPAVAYDDISINVINNLYERLVTYDSESSTEIVPMLAKNKLAQEDTTFIFYMRGDVKFSSGRIVDAEAVKYSITRVLKMGQAPSWMVSQILNESGIELGDYDFDGIQDVKFILERPYSGFYHILAFSVCSIVDPAEVDANGGVTQGQINSWMGHNSAGSGPFRVKDSWVESERKLNLERNKHYHEGWDGNHVDTIRFKLEESDTLRLKAIKDDKADMADIPITLLSNASEITSIKIDIRDTMSVVYIGFNTKTAPYNDINVRNAFAFAFNYNDMMDNILEKKYGDRLYGPIPKDVLGYDANLETRFYYDRENALDAFEAAGYTIDEGNVTDFPAVTFTVPSNTSVMGRIMYQFKANLQDLGLEVNLAYMNLTQYITSLENGDFPIFLTGWSADYADPDDFVYPLLHSESTNLSISNQARYSNDTVDEMIEDAMVTLNPEDRKVLYRDIQNAVNREVPYIWLYQPKAISVLRNDVSGYNRHPILGTDLYEISFVE